MFFFKIKKSKKKSGFNYFFSKSSQIDNLEKKNEALVNGNVRKPGLFRTKDEPLGALGLDRLCRRQDLRWS